MSYVFHFTQVPFHLMSGLFHYQRRLEYHNIQYFDGPESIGSDKYLSPKTKYYVSPVVACTTSAQTNNIYKNNDNNELLTEDDYLSLLITYFDDIKSLKNINYNTNESFLLSNDEDLDDLSSVLVEKSSEDCSS